MRTFCSVLPLASLLAIGLASCGGEEVLSGVDRIRDEGGPRPVSPYTGEVESVQHALPPAPTRVTPSFAADVPEARDGAPYPIVLVHGFTGFTDLGPLDYFFGVPALFEDLGAEVFAPAQPPYHDSATRARVLAEHVDQILAHTNRRKVHLICHSQGGLDCRRLVSAVPTFDFKVATITTIATPHRGTPVADLAQSAPDGVLNPAGQFLAWMLGFLEGEPPEQGAWDSEATVEAGDWEPDLARSVDQLSTDGAAAFNAAHPDTDTVPIFSVGAYSGMIGPGDVCDGGLLFEPTARVDALDPFLWATGASISGLDLLDPRRNDGLVPTDSMIWGTFLGCVPADHLDEVGQIGDLGPALISGFDHKEDLYRRLLTFLRDWEQEHAPLDEPKLMTAPLDDEERAGLFALLAEYRAARKKVDDAAGAVFARRDADVACGKGCAACCVGGLTVLPVEAFALKFHVEERGVPPPAPRDDGRCPFLDEAGACTVYDARPLVCRTQGLPLRLTGATDAERANLRVIDDVACCELNFEGADWRDDDVLDLERIQALLTVVDRRFREQAGLAHDVGRVPLAALVPDDD